MNKTQKTFCIKVLSALSFAFSLGSTPCFAEHKLVFDKMNIDEREHTLILETSFNPNFGWETQYETLVADIQRHKQEELDKLCPSQSAIQTLTAKVQTTPGLKNLIPDILKHAMEKEPNFKLELSGKDLINTTSSEDDYIAKITFTEAVCTHKAASAVRGSTVTPEMNFADSCIETSHFNTKTALIVGGAAIACACVIAYSYKSEKVSCAEFAGASAKTALSAVVQAVGEDTKKAAIGVAAGALFKSIPLVTKMIFTGRDDPKAVSYALSENIKRHREFCCSRKPELHELCSEFTELEDLAGEYKKEINRYYKQAGGWTYWATGYMSVHQDDKDIFIEKLNALNDSNRLIFRQCAHIDKTHIDKKVSEESKSPKKSPRSKHKE